MRIVTEDCTWIVTECLQRYVFSQGTKFLSINSQKEKHKNGLYIEST